MTSRVLPLTGRRSSTPIPHARGHMYDGLRAACQPRPITSVADWADRYRILSAKGSSEPGQWRTDRAPFTREIMDCLSTHSPVQRIVLKFSAQSAKTEIGLNWLGYIMHHSPGPTLVVLPTLEVRKRWVRQRLDPMLSDSPILRDLFDTRRKRDSSNSEDIKDFPGGMLVIGGANSPASLASMPIKNVFCDEIDRFPWEAGKEGDPLSLIETRTNNFPRRKILLASTPTVAGLSRIHDEYEASDQREQQVPCPHCARMQVLQWTHPDEERGLYRNPATGVVYYRCLHCHERIDEHHKTVMLAAGRWVPRYPGRPVAGFAISSLYSPIGLGLSWSELLDKWDGARSDATKLKEFINTNLGEVWTEQGDSIDAMHLLCRIEHYPDPLPVRLRTAGVDVQKDRLEVSIVDWGEGEQAWLRDHHILPGDTALGPVWEELGDLLATERVQAAVIDTGYNSTQGYAFCKSRGWCWPGKGIGGGNRPIVEDDGARKRRLRRRRKKDQPVEPIGVDQAKTLIYSRLKLIEPGPGYVHFPNEPAFDDEYFAQLSAEKLITKVQGNRAYAEWVQTRARNEALDCLVYALAAARLSGIDLKATPAASPDDAKALAKRFHITP